MNELSCCSSVIDVDDSDEFYEHEITEVRQRDETAKGKIDGYTYINTLTTRQSLRWRGNLRCPNDGGIMRLSSASRTLVWDPTAHCSDTRVDDFDAPIVPAEIADVFIATASGSATKAQWGSSVFGSVRSLQGTSTAPTNETLCESFGISKHFCLCLSSIGRPPRDIIPRKRRVHSACASLPPFSL